MHTAYDTKCTKAGCNDTGRGKYANKSGKRRQYKRHSKPKTLTEEEVRRCEEEAREHERWEAEDAYRKHLLKALAARRGVEESKVLPNDVGYMFGRRRFLREIMATIKGVDPEELSWDEVEKEFERKNNAGGEYGEGLDLNNLELCEEVNRMRARLEYLEKYPSEDDAGWHITGDSGEEYGDEYGYCSSDDGW